MSIGKPLPAKVGIIADRAAIPAWVVALREFVLDLGVGQVVVAAETGPGRNRAVNLLLTLERVLQGRDRHGWTRLLSDDEIDIVSLDVVADCDFIIDLRSDIAAVPGARGRVLRPLYDGTPGELALCHALFFSGTPQIIIADATAGHSLRACASGRASLEAASGYASAMEAVWSRVHYLIAKVFAGHTYLATEKDNHLTDVGSPKLRIPVTQICKRKAKLLATAAAKALYRLSCDAPYWRVGYRFNAPTDDVWAHKSLEGGRWNILPAKPGRFVADPVPVFWQGRYHVFVEELPYQTQKGIISCSIFDEDGKPGPSFPVLEEPWHLSYPFIWVEGDEIYMIPEASLSGEISLYRAVDFPHKWERHATLVSGVEAADATIVRHGGKLWMFAVIRSAIGGYSDTLAIWSADRLIGPWTAHRQNPIMVDDRFARPAGNMVVRNGALLRPVQDCRRGYGTGLNLMQIIRLDDEAFEQKVLAELVPGGPEWPGHKLHMLNRAERLEVIDGSVIRPKSALLNGFVERHYTPRSAG